MLNAIGVSKRFGENEALKGVSISVQPGEIYCLLGANGAGKTTLINLFLNFLQPTTGEVRIDGISVADDALQTKKRPGYIPEKVTLYPVLSGLENLAFFSALATGKRLPQERLLELLESVGLAHEAAERRVASYSKGMRQKVGIAIALAKNAKALLLDEPTSGLDPSAADEFSALLRQARENGVAILTTTHDLFHAKQTGSRIGIMKRGEMIEELSGDEISHADLQSLYLSHMRA